MEGRAPAFEVFAEGLILTLTLHPEAEDGSSWFCIKPWAREMLALRAVSLTRKWFRVAV